MDLQAKSGPAWKICGLTRAEDVSLCLELGVPYVGFNFHPGSKRHVTPAKAAEAWRLAVRNHGSKPLASRPVAVVVDWDPTSLGLALKEFPELAVVQFHGKESPATLATHKATLAGRVAWKAYGVAKAEDLDLAKTYAEAVSLVLLDSAAVAPGQDVAGGSGKSFDWNWIKANRPSLPFGLAGGIGPKNVKQALALRPDLIDLCSGVEASPGIKDPALMKALAREIGPA